MAAKLNLVVAVSLAVLAIVASSAFAQRQPTRPGPTGRPTGPTGRPTRPTGRPTGPTGRPTGRPTLPPGQLLPCDRVDVTDATTCASFCGNHSLTSNFTETTSSSPGHCCCVKPDGQPALDMWTSDDGPSRPTMRPRPTRPGGDRWQSHCCVMSGGNDPHNPALCDLNRWKQCGAGISTTLLKCASCVNDEDDDNPEVGDKCKACIDSIFLDSDVTEATCCPCLWRFGQLRNATWMQVDC